MFRDIEIFIDRNKVDFDYEIDKDKIIIKLIDELEIGKVLKIYYDENIYEIKPNDNKKFSEGKAGELFINLNIKELSFSVVLKNNFFVKSVYKYINKLINKDTLINEIKIFMNSDVGKKYKEDLNILLDNIENKDKSLEELIINNEDECQRVFDLVIHNKTYIGIAENMSDLELMLLITSYIFVPFTPNINQDYFDDLVKAAENYDNALENIWRLGMNYDYKGYNFDLLDNFFVDSKDIYYLGEYISGIHQTNQEKIVNAILATKDKDFIKRILVSDLIIDHLDDKYKNILESSI